MRRSGAILGLLLTVACASETDVGRSVQESSGARDEPWSDVTSVSGVTFIHDNGASDRRLLPETMGSGVAIFDYDGDGWLDLFFVNGSSKSQASLFRNLGDWRFENVTQRSGAGIELVGMGVASGDIDRDGDTDLFVSGVGRDVLLRNRNDGTFEDASHLIANLPAGFSSSAAFLDADNDGWLDLFVGRYVTWSLETDVPCLPDGRQRSYCTPEVYPGAISRLLRNPGGGARFVDVTNQAGLGDHVGKALGVVPFHHDDNGALDLAVASDTERNFLFVNRGDGTFDEQGVELGMAYSQSGAPRGGMGIDAGQLSGNGCSDIVIGNFAQEMSAIFRCGRGGLYSDDSAYLGVGLPTLLTLAFGTLIVDLDHDGRKDIVLANGHIEPEIEKFRPNQSYAQPLQIFRQTEVVQGFEPVFSTALAAPRVGRGLAMGDLDGDGDADLVLTQNGGPAILLQNGRTGGSWLELSLSSDSLGTAAYGARAVVVAEGIRQEADLVSGRSYLSASEATLSFGLGDLEGADTVEISWPNGHRTRARELSAGYTYTFVSRPESDSDRLPPKQR